MTLPELIELLEAVLLTNDPTCDVEILTITTIGTLVRPTQIGTVNVIPVIPGSEADKRLPSRRLLPGGEWRIPTSSQDEPEVKRERHFIIR